MGSNYEHVHGNETLNMHLSMDISANGLIIESYGLSNREAETDVLQHSTRRFQNAIMGSGQTFSNVYAFRGCFVPNVFIREISVLLQKK